MVKPIPRRLLIHTATLSDVTLSAFQSESLRTVAVLQHVRIETSEKLVITKDNRQISLAATLFFDCRNSKPSYVQFSVGQRITFAGAVYRIETVEPVYDDTRLHHYELGLS